jgi:cellulose synthase/poly-beta-1,6-N-acetylglucosamine synthase-like glycosyltransferase
LARGDILAFADDDTLVTRNWARALAHVFMSAPAVMAVAGLVMPHELETEAQQAFERYGGFDRGYERRWYSVSGRHDPSEAFHIGAGMFGTGANMAFRRSVFAEIGDFDVALDVGTPTGGGGDLDMFFRVIEHEMVLVYEPAAIVRHRHRRSYAELQRQIMTWGTGFLAFLMRNAAAYPRRRWTILRFAAWYLVWRYLRGVLKAIRARSAWRVKLVCAEAWGALMSVSCYLRSRRIATQVDASPAD